MPIISLLDHVQRNQNVKEMKYDPIKSFHKYQMDFHHKMEENLQAFQIQEYPKPTNQLRYHDLYL